MPADHPLAQRHEIDFASTIAFGQVNLHEASAIYAFLRRICDDMGAVLKVRLLVSIFETACRLIEAGAGIGIGIVPESAARRHAQTMKLALVELRDAWSLRELVVCVRDQVALPSFARDMVELLMADAQAADGPR